MLLCRCVFNIIFAANDVGKIKELKNVSHGTLNNL